MAPCSPRRVSFLCVGQAALGAVNASGLEFEVLHGYDSVDAAVSLSRR